MANNAKSVLAELLEHGKRSGKLTTKEITDALEELDFDVEDIECPYCGEPIAIDADILDSDDDFIVCPACGKEFELEFDDLCDCGCGCDCDCDDDEE